MKESQPFEKTFEVDKRQVSVPVHFDRRSESRCTACNRLLSKPLMRITLISISKEEFDIFMKGIEIMFGTETKCRSCKQIRETREVILNEKDIFNAR